MNRTPYRTLIRLPQSLAVALKAAAATEGVSLNTLLIQRLAATVQLDAAVAELADVLDAHLISARATNRAHAERTLARLVHGQEPHQC